MSSDPYQNAVEAYEIARQMALDLNQEALVREFWEGQRRRAEAAIHESFDRD